MVIQINPLCANNSPYHLILGNGRLAKHLLHYFQLLNWPVRQWTRQAHSEQELLALAPSAYFIWLCISDTALAPRIESLKAYQHKIVQCSGSLHFEGVFNRHPLASFGEYLFTDEFYSQIHWISSDAQKSFLPAFENNTHYLDKEQKALYHALCVLTGPGTSLLWQHFIDEIKKLKISKQAAGSYFASLWLNYQRQHQPQITGPWVRNDLQTIESNEFALKQNSHVLNIYKEMHCLFNLKKFD